MICVFSTPERMWACSLNTRQMVKITWHYVTQKTIKPNICKTFLSISSKFVLMYNLHIFNNKKCFLCYKRFIIRWEMSIISRKVTICIYPAQKIKRNSKEKIPMSIILIFFVNIYILKFQKAVICHFSWKFVFYSMWICSLIIISRIIKYLS